MKPSINRKSEHLYLNVNYVPQSQSAAVEKFRLLFVNASKSTAKCRPTIPIAKVNFNTIISLGQLV